jgi:ABC-2 type transport system ATP-binding protein
MIKVRSRRTADLPTLARALSAVGSSPPRIDADTNRGRRSAIMTACKAPGGIEVEVNDIGLRRPTLDEVFLTRWRQTSR